MSTMTFELRESVTTTAVRVKAASQLATDTIVWVEVSIHEVRGLGSRAKRLYLFLKRKPDPLTTTRTRRFKQTTTRPAARTTTAKSMKTTTGAATTPANSIPTARDESVGELKCTPLSSSYALQCSSSSFSTIDQCAGLHWSAQFELAEGIAPLTSVRITSRALPLVDTNEAKARLDAAARAAVNTSWSRGKRATRFTYNVSASCCLCELRLALADQLGLYSLCRSSPCTRSVFLHSFVAIVIAQRLRGLNQRHLILR